jgi:hypothetical protein
MKTIQTAQLLVVLALTVLLGTGCERKFEERVPIAPAPPGMDASGVIRNDVTWPDVHTDPLKADYEIETSAVIEDNVMVLIAPGVVIKFTGVNAGITVNNGALRAVGTETNPIVLEGSEESRGSWLGIRIRTNNPANELKHCKVRFAGSDGEGAVQVRGLLSGTYDSYCKITNCEISQSSSFGLFLDTKTTVDFANNTIVSNSNAPVRMTTLQLGSLDAASNYSNNAAGNIQVEGQGEIMSSIVMPKLIIPYSINSGTIKVRDGNLTVNPGVEMRFKPNTGIEVMNNGVGTLTAVGSATNRITFKGIQAGQGGWNGIAIFGASISNRFEYCTIDGGGQNPMGLLNTNGKGLANVVVGNCSVQYPAAAFNNCTFSNSRGFGIWKGGQAAAQVNPGLVNADAATTNTFNNNLLGAIGE